MLAVGGAISTGLAKNEKPSAVEGSRFAIDKSSAAIGGVMAASTDEQPGPAYNPKSALAKANTILLLNINSILRIPPFHDHYFAYAAAGL
jgi:hypothetical protein